MPTTGGGHRPEAELDRLSNILKTFNDQFGNMLKHCRTLIEAESEASKDTKEAQAHLDQNVLAGYATVALASILDPSGGLFSDAARPGQCPFSYFAQTWHSKIAIRDESQK